jgi:hypothetical protein
MTPEGRAEHLEDLRRLDARALVQGVVDLVPGTRRELLRRLQGPADPPAADPPGTPAPRGACDMRIAMEFRRDSRQITVTSSGRTARDRSEAAAMAQQLRDLYRDGPAPGRDGPPPPTSPGVDHAP